MEKIPCSKERKQTCKYNLGRMGCHTSVHHEFWPKKDYKTPVERRFRELDENKVRMCRLLHDVVHLEDPPEKPTRDEMTQAIHDHKQAILTALPTDPVQVEARRIETEITGQTGAA